MQIGIDTAQMSVWSALAERCGRLDPRGAYFNQKHVFEAILHFATSEEYKPVVERAAAEQGKFLEGTMDSWCKREAYGLRVILSHYRLKCREHKQLTDAPGPSHTSEMLRVYASFTRIDVEEIEAQTTQVRQQPSISQQPSTSISQQPFICLQTAASSNNSRYTTPSSQLFPGVPMTTSIDNLDAAAVDAVAAALGFVDDEVEASAAAEDDDADIPTEIVCTFCWKTFVATMLMSDGSMVPAVSYKHGDEGTVLAVFPSHTTTELEVPNCRLQADGTFLKQVTKQPK